MAQNDITGQDKVRHISLVSTKKPNSYIMGQKSFWHLNILKMVAKQLSESTDQASRFI